MNLRAILAPILLLSLSSPALAGGRGGHNTTFDPNSYGGSWTTISCDGSSADQTSLTNFRDTASAANPTLAKLRLTGICNFTGGDQLFWDGIVGSTKYIQNSVVWAYGATANLTQIGGGTVPITSGSVSACAWSARINTVSAGATAVVLVDGTMVDGSSAAGVFPAGTNVMVAGIELQNGGYPQNFQLFEYGVVTGVSGNTITLGAPLANTYKSTWPPFVFCPSGVDGAGPATIFKLLPSFDVNFSLYGLTNNRSDCGQVGVLGRNVMLYDVTINVGCAISGYPTASENWWGFFVNFPGSSEFDKEVQSLNFYRGHIGAIGIQSVSITQLNLTSVTAGSTTGMPPLNARIVNSDLGSQAVPHLGLLFGSGNSLALDGTTISSVEVLPFVDLLSYYSYSSGTFSFPLASATTAVSVFTPGSKYVIVYYVGGPSHTPCSPSYVFTVSDLATNGTDFQAATTGWTQDGSPIATPSSLPALTNACGGNTANSVSGFVARTITQINSPAGSVSVTGYAAPP